MILCKNITSHILICRYFLPDTQPITGVLFDFPTRKEGRFDRVKISLFEYRLLQIEHCYHLYKTVIISSNCI